MHLHSGYTARERDALASRCKLQRATRGVYCMCIFLICACLILPCDALSSRAFDALYPMTRLALRHTSDCWARSGGKKTRQKSASTGVLYLYLSSHSLSSESQHSLLKVTQIQLSRLQI